MDKKIIIIFLIISSIFYSQDKEIDEVVIQGKFFDTPYNKVTDNIVVIGAQEIKNSPAKNIVDVLQYFAGIDIRKRGVNGIQTDISIRGGTYDQVLILVNGIRMNDSQTGHNSFNIPIDISNVSQIEVIKGPAARRFGNNAYAGVINIITKIKRDKNVKITAEGGDYKTYSLGANINLGNEKFSQSLQANSSYSEGYRYNTDYEINNVFYQNQLSIKEGEIGFQAGFLEKKFGANGFYGSSAEQYEEIQTSIVSLFYKQKLGKLGLNSQAYWRRGQDMYLWIRNNPDAYRNMHIGNNVGGQINFSYDNFLGITGLGLEIGKEFLVSSNLGERNRFLTQVFFEHRFSLINKKLQIIPGISWAKYSTTEHFFYPGIDVGFNIDDDNKIYANVSKINRIPTFTDLYYTSRTDLGNPNLNPERAISTEIGYHYSGSKIIAKISGFMRNSNNAIDWVKYDINDRWEANNIGKIDIKGIETEFTYRPFYWLNYNIGYTYIDNKRKLSNNMYSKYALENLKHQLVTKLETRFLKHFYNQLVYRYNKRLDGLNYHLLDYKISFKKGNFDIYGLINNITNTTYEELSLVPLPKRWFNIGINYGIKLE